MTHWHTADTHFGHESIIPFWGRPFRHASHMDSVLIERMWEKVGRDDDLWIIGDLACGPKAQEEDWLRMLCGQLPGARRHLVVGNHDGSLTQALSWDSLSWLVEVNDPLADHRVILCHYPMITGTKRVGAGCTCSAMYMAIGRGPRTVSMSAWMCGTSARSQ